MDLEFDQTLSAWPEREAGGAELLRIRVGAYIDTLPEFVAAGLRTGDPLPGCGPLVTMGPLKIISDGSLNTHTAWCCDAVRRRGRQGSAEPHRRGAARADDPCHAARSGGRHPRDR